MTEVNSKETLIAGQMLTLMVSGKPEREVGQALYGLYQFLTNPEASMDVEASEVYAALLEQAKAEGVYPEASSFRDPALRQRAEQGYAALTAGLDGEPAAFEEAFAAVLAYYRAFPWYECSPFPRSS